MQMGKIRSAIITAIVALATLALFFFGAVLFGLTLVVWLVFFFSGVHLDDEKAFGKYRIRR